MLTQKRFASVWPNRPLRKQWTKQIYGTTQAAKSGGIINERSTHVMPNYAPVPQIADSKRPRNSSVPAFSVVAAMSLLANVSPRYGQADGELSDPLLELAHIGGKAITTRLKLRLDEKVEWTAEKFRVAACHELGHILGLKHSHRSDQLTSPFLNLENGIVKPQDKDIERIQRIWGEAKLPAKG